MKFYNISDIEGFFNAVNTCKGKVELVTEDGDRINLKSRLSQYFSMAKVLSDGKIGELELITEYTEDDDKLVRFVLGTK